ncbi:hypothetical protein NDU88_003949 [Pleurodeles waltl]|uniref:Uncharacterized protein n=1 Tax=Pleurodeles waltl TaxID=8319 RepID=A0AAV7TPX4_PLEWA|nr:hypothetical protein NDU88_003949 [Pleurodeles waltl]
MSACGGFWPSSSRKPGAWTWFGKKPLGPLPLALRASAGVAAVVLACSLLRAGGKAEQVRRGRRAGVRPRGRGVELSFRGISKYSPCEADAQGKTRRVC